MYGFYLVHLWSCEPVSIIICRVIAKIFKAVIESPKIFFKPAFSVRQINHNVERESTAKLVVKKGHALINLRALTKVVDETVFHP